MIPIKNKEAKTTPLNKVEKPKIPALTGLEGQGETLMLAETKLFNSVEEDPENCESPTDFFCSLKDCIRAALPLKHQQPLVAESEWTVKYLINHVDEAILQEVLNQVEPLAFGRFLVAVGLFETDGGRDFCILLEDCEEEAVSSEGDWELPHFDLWVKNLVDEINHKATFPFYRETVEKLSNFFLLSKEEVINDFVVPFYKVGKASHLWLEDLTDSAFNRGLKAKLGLSPQIYIDSVNGFVSDLTDADHVSIFEYVLEGQDLQNLHSSTTLTESEIRFLLDLNCGDLDGIHQRLGGWPSDFVGEVLYLQEAYGFCLGDFLKSPRFTEGEERLKTPFEISDFLESFQPLASSYYEDNLGYSTPIYDWKALLDFAVYDGDLKPLWGNY